MNLSLCRSLASPLRAVHRQCCPSFRRCLADAVGGAQPRKPRLWLVAGALGGACVILGTSMVQAVRKDLGNYPTLAAWLDTVSGRETKEKLMHSDDRRGPSARVLAATKELDITLYQYHTCPFSSKVSNTITCTAGTVCVHT